MRSLFPFFALFRLHWLRLALGTLLAILGLSASIGLLSLSGWFLSSSFLIGSILFFNVFPPSSGVRGFAMGRTAARYVEKLATHDATFRVLAHLRVAIFNKLIPLSPADLQRFRHSDLLNRLVADVDTLDALYLTLINPFISALFVIGFIGIGLSFLSIQIALSVIVFLLALLVLLPCLFYRLGRKNGKAAVQARARYRTQFIDWISLNAELTLFGQTEAKVAELNQTEQAWQQAQSCESRLVGLSNALVVLSNGVLVWLTIWLAAHGLGVSNSPSDARVALVVFCVLASGEILAPIGLAFLHLGQVIASSERLTELTERTPQVRFTQDQPWQMPEAEQGFLRFEELCFHYPTQAHSRVLQQLNLSVNRHEKIAILGKTGCGKSTLFQLLMRNYAPNAGQIWLNQQPIEAYSEATLRSKIALLSQRVHIFSATLAENLRIGAPNASDEALKAVLQRVGLGKLLEEDAGLELWLGDGGRPLSGGEQRRLGLARLLLNDAPIVLLDEPTEGLDHDTERQILEHIFVHCANRTLLMITHRKQGLAGFDRVLHLDNGALSTAS